MLAVEVTRWVEAPVEIVWSTIVAVADYPGVVRSYVRVEHLTAETAGLGASWRQTRTVFGREHAQVLRIVEWDPPRRYATEARESGAAYTTTYRLTPAGPATEVTAQFSVAATNPIGAAVQRLFGGRLMASTRDALERDLADVAAAAEGRAAAG